MVSHRLCVKTEETEDDATEVVGGWDGSKEVAVDVALADEIETGDEVSEDDAWEGTVAAKELFL